MGRVTPSYALHPKMVGAWARGRVGAQKKARRLLIYY
nr:MAG TPA_asm: hypothetical protein [Caudoviricetes sp.]